MRGLAGLLALLGLSAAQAAELAVGHEAPGFRLPDQSGAAHALADYRGRWVILYFYPKDDTPGCTTEACNFRDAITAITALNTQVLGVSVDDTASHAQFAQKHRLPFPLLADRDGQVARAYGALWSLGPVQFARRHSFIIDPDGKIAKIYRAVDAERHSREVQDDLKALQQSWNK
jgi:peroxiredoxin Q/BCP